MKQIIKHMVSYSACLLVYTFLTACTISPIAEKQSLNKQDSQQVIYSNNLNIKGLAPCNDNPDESLILNNNKPLTVLVHGCNGSVGRFRTLSQVFDFHGQQSICFTYNDRDKIMRSSRQLADALEQLVERFGFPQITVVGHSQGGLVARKALISERENPIELTSTPVRLITVSAPFSGVRAARFCAMPVIRFATFGLHDLACWLVSGSKWYEITSASSFIKKPGALSTSVASHLLIATDERNSCRLFNREGECIRDDFVFSLDEQQLPVINSGINAKEVSVQAGHIEIVGESGITPIKLIKILQQEGYIRPTELSRQAEFNHLLARLYDIQPGS